MLFPGGSVAPRGRGKSIWRRASYFCLCWCSGSQGLKNIQFVQKYQCEKKKKRRIVDWYNSDLVWTQWVIVTLRLKIAGNYHKDIDRENSIIQYINPNRCFSCIQFSQHTNRLEVTWHEGFWGAKEISLFKIKGPRWLFADLSSQPPVEQPHIINTE